MPEEHNWTELARSIQKGRTVLVLGPDALPFYRVGPSEGVTSSHTLTDPSGSEGVTSSHTLTDTDPSFSQIARRRIQEKLNGQITHFYGRDNLFLFASPRAKRDAIDCLEETITEAEWLPDSELLRKIVAIPFPVVLNFNPDKYAYDAFLKYYHAPQFDYFTAKHKTGHYGIQHDPDGYDHPVVYNLCGSVLDALDSVILDHYDLFGLLKALLNDTGVSEKLLNKLQVADRFILLGFELERWYFQVFLHYLNRLDKEAFNNYNQNFPILSHVGDDSRAFVMKQFNIEHFAPSREDFEKLYEACKALGILRKLHDPAAPVVEQIRGLAAQDKLEEAFRLFEQHCPDGDLRNLQLPLLRGRYAQWLEWKRRDTEEVATLRRELNSIRFALLTFAHQIPPDHG